MLRPCSILLSGALGLLACNRSPSRQPATTATEATVQTPGNGVHLEGVVRVHGAPTLPPVSTSASVSRVCGEQIPNRSVQVDSEGRLEDAVVSIDGAPAATSPVSQRAPTLDQKQCDYSPHVLAARVGATLTMVNSDPLVHSLHGAEDGRALFNFAQPITGMRNQKPLPAQPGVVEIRCELHPWMQAFVKVFDARHAFALTDAQGHFSLDGVPAGRHTVTVWQPRLGEHSLSVDVRPGMGPLSVDWNVGS